MPRSRQRGGVGLDSFSLHVEWNSVSAIQLPPTAPTTVTEPRPRLYRAHLTEYRELGTASKIILVRVENFKTYQLAKNLYQQCQKLELTAELKNQLHRASLSIVFNLAEASGKMTNKEQARFYNIALGSLRETQALLDLIDHQQLSKEANVLGGFVWRLIESRQAPLP